MKKFEELTPEDWAFFRALRYIACDPYESSQQRKRERDTMFLLALSLYGHETYTQVADTLWVEDKLKQQKEHLNIGLAE